jgi:agmatine/peptidylarginine deiminase
MRQSPDLGPQPPGQIGDGAPGERQIVVRRDSALILLNLTVSIEWDADQAYVDDLALGLRRASAFLYDVTDGQMALGRVAIFERGERWADADIRIAANNQIYPRAAVAGINAERTDFNVRLGPLWNGSSARLRGEEGPWSRPIGYRTIVHELGHYVLGLFDEYIYYVQTANGLNVEPAYCTHPETAPPSGNPPPETLRASIMDNQHIASELADAGQPVLWSEACKQTEQWTRNGVSDWETVWQRFRAAEPAAASPCGAATALQAAYCLWRPAAGSRAAVVPQPSLDPPAQRGWPWPVIERHASPSGPPLRDLYVQWTGPEQPGRSYRLRAVVRQVVDGRITYIEQGLTGYDDHITLFGASEGATVLLNTLDRSLQPSVQVTSSQAITLTLHRPALSLAASSGSSPRMVLSPQADGQGLTVEAAGGPPGELWAEYVLAGQEAQRAKLIAAGEIRSTTLPVDLRFRASGAIAIVDSESRREHLVSLLCDWGVPTHQLTYAFLPVRGSSARDSGPAFIQRSNGTLAISDPASTPANAPSASAGVADLLKLPVIRVPLLMEWGNLLSNGNGLAITTTHLLLRNQVRGYDEAQIMQILRDHYGIEQCIVLQPLVSEPSGQVDRFATFLSEDTVLLGTYDRRIDPINADVLDYNARLLSRVQTRKGPLRVLRVPMPPKLGGIWRSYTSVVYANGQALIPRYPDIDDGMDQAAMKFYADILRGTRIIAINSSSLAAAGATLRSISINIPALSPAMATSPG